MTAISASAFAIAAFGFTGCFIISYKVYVALREKAKLRELRSRLTLFPTGKDPEKEFAFYAELTLAEEKFVASDIEGGAEHWANAIMLCAASHRKRWNKVLQRLLAPRVYGLITKKIRNTFYSVVLQSMKRLPTIKE